MPTECGAWLQVQALAGATSWSWEAPPHPPFSPPPSLTSLPVKEDPAAGGLGQQVCPPGREEALSMMGTNTLSEKYSVTHGLVMHGLQ